MSREPDHTDEFRRLALQLALQLPANVADARQVLKLTEECLDGFLIEPSAASPLARARRLGWGVAVAPAGQSGDAPAIAEAGAVATALCCLAALVLSSGLGLLLLAMLGAGTGVSSALAVAVIGLLFGTRPAALLAVLAACLTNLFVVPPSFDFTVPTTVELAILLVNLAIAVLVPWIQARREPLREASLRVAGRPVKRLSRAA